MSSSRVTRSSNATRAHPPPKTRTGAVNFAIFTYLNTHRYLFPRTFPFIEETQLPKCFEPTMPIIGKPAEELEYATKRDFYFKIGVGILPHCLFLLSEDAIHGKPAGYALDIRSAVQANAVLKRLAATVDPRIIKQISTGAAGGFLTFVGLLWTLRARNTESVARELQPFFLPLLEVAGDAWLSFENRNAVTSNSAASVHPEALRAADLRFIVNVQISQDTCPPVPRPLAEDSASSNSDSSDGSLCDSPSTHQPTIVPKSPAVNGSPLRNPYLLTFRSPSHAEVAVPNQVSSRLSGSPMSPVAAPGALLPLLSSTPRRHTSSRRRARVLLARPQFGCPSLLRTARARAPRTSWDKQRLLPDARSQSRNSRLSGSLMVLLAPRASLLLLSLTPRRHTSSRRPARVLLPRPRVGYPSLLRMAGARVHGAPNPVRVLSFDYINIIFLDVVH